MNKTKEIYLAGGCFWGTEHYFKQIEGVVETEVGFANGNTENPTYKEVYTDTTGYAETVYVKYDPDVVSLEFLLQMFFKAIDPTSLNKQGHDEGTRYRTGIYFTDSEDLPVIEKVFAEEQKNYQQPLAVEKLPLKNFYTAEEYHQDYLDKNPTGYCHLPQSLFEFARKAKKQILFLFAALLVLSCGSKTGKVASETDSLTVDSVVEEAGIDKHSEEYIRQRIDTIYKTVGKRTYDSNGNEVSYIRNPFNRDSAYCSQRYYALMQEALQICNENDDILYDYDHWVCGQDWSDDWSCKVAKIYELTDSTALVDLDIHNFDDLKTTIALRFERNDWYIDDFSPSKDGDDDKKYLRDTIRRGLEMRNGMKKDLSEYAE